MRDCTVISATTILLLPINSDFYDFLSNGKGTPVFT